jgi:hypothetical protein
MRELLTEKKMEEREGERKETGEDECRDANRQ